MPSRNEVGKSWWEHAFVLGILTTMVAIHARGLGAPFFADDYLFLEQVRGRSLLQAITAPDPLGNFLRPVSRQVYFWAIGRIGFESSLVFHCVGLLCGIASALCLYALIRRLVGRTGAMCALAFFGLHYAFDVPIGWAAGSQDTLALLFAIAAITLHSARQRLAAAMALALALLSKETVAGTALIAVAVDHALGQPWRAAFRRAGGLIGVTAAWALWWAFTKEARPGAANALSFDVEHLLATGVHLIQVITGAEARMGGAALGHWRLMNALPAAVAAGGLWLVARRLGTATGDGPHPSARSVCVVGLVWTLAGMAPVVLVAPIWSAYYYLWALGGVAVLLAVAAERVPRMVSVGSIAALVLLSSNARRLDEFAVNQSPWTWQSHVNRHYIARSVATVERFLADMKGARSALPERSTVFFANVPTMSGWQAGNGPLVRWAYRDTSLRSYYLNEFSRERAQRGPMFFFAVVGDSLCDRTGDPQMLSSLALSMMLAEHPHAALDAIEVALASEPLDRQFLTYWRGVLHLAVGNRGMADRDLRATGIKPDSTTPPGVAAGLDQTSGYEARLSYLTKMRARAGYSPWIHARLAATFLDGKQVVDGSIEAYAFRILSPNDPEAWRKWAAAQLAHQQWGPALASLKRYVVLANAARRSDPEARAVIASLEKVVHGSVAQKALRPGTAK